MHLEFIFGAQTPAVSFGDHALQVRVSNAACPEDPEVWKIPDGVRRQRGAFHCVESDQYRLGAASIAVKAETLAEQSEDLFESILCDIGGCSLYRVWLFVPRINDRPGGGLENYQQFCKGRALAFERHTDRDLTSKIPAASAVGTDGQHLTVVYFAGRTEARHIENPRQTPAYRYPREYGPKAPAFARATAFDYKGDTALFVSGTSSILASESVGATIETQLETTLENIDIVTRRSPSSRNSRRKIRVYLRHEKDLSYVQTTLSEHYLKPSDEVTYVIADICRKELQIEIEVTIGL